MINDQPWTAPTEELESVIMNYCMNVLKLPFGEFWYKWFESSSYEQTKNMSLHIECNDGKLIEVIKQTLNKIPEIPIQKYFKLQCLPLPEYCDYKFLYHLHFKKQ